jgi:hypothetical protein
MLATLHTNMSLNRYKQIYIYYILKTIHDMIYYQHIILDLQLKITLRIYLY